MGEDHHSCLSGTSPSSPQAPRYAPAHNPAPQKCSSKTQWVCPQGFIDFSSRNRKPPLNECTSYTHEACKSEWSWTEKVNSRFFFTLRTRMWPTSHSSPRCILTKSSHGPDKLCWLPGFTHSSFLLAAKGPHHWPSCSLTPVRTAEEGEGDLCEAAGSGCEVRS